MLNDKDHIRLRHMLDYSREALTLIEGKGRKELDQDRTLNLALVRLVEIVGEAANRVSNETQGAYAEIPWFQIVSLRNRLIHGYDSVDFDILWGVLTEELPILVAALVKIVPPE
jgi:uncharacterized protein with HEPN domain